MPREAMIESAATTHEVGLVEVCGVVVEPGRIQSPALRRIVIDMACQDEVTLASCRHKDWQQQAQCGCVMGCLGG